jgi:Flp pilus assembly protein protease CpaA
MRLAGMDLSHVGLAGCFASGISSGSYALEWMPGEPMKGLAGVCLLSQHSEAVYKYGNSGLIASVYTPGPSVRRLSCIGSL